MGKTNFKPSSFYLVRFTVDQRPALDGTPVAGLPVGIFGFKNKAGIDDKVQHGLILKADVNGMVLAGGIDLDIIDRLAFDFFKSVEPPPAIAADGRLPAFGFGESQ